MIQCGLTYEAGVTLTFNKSCEKTKTNIVLNPFHTCPATLSSPRQYSGGGGEGGGGGGGEGRSKTSRPALYSKVW